MDWMDLGLKAEGPLLGADEVVHITLAANSRGGVDVAAVGLDAVRRTTGGQAVAHMAWDVLAHAALKGARMGGAVEAQRVAPHLLVALARAVLDPEVFGHAVSAEVRAMARLGLGLKPLEAGLCSAASRVNHLLTTNGDALAPDLRKPPAARALMVGAVMAVTEGGVA